MDVMVLFVLQNYEPEKTFLERTVQQLYTLGISCDGINQSPSQQGQILRPRSSDPGVMLKLSPNGTFEIWLSVRMLKNRLLAICHPFMISGTLFEWIGSSI